MQTPSGLLSKQVLCGGKVLLYLTRRSIFWLPGASHSGGGNGAEGNYWVCINGAGVKNELFVNILKKDTNVEIKQVRNSSPNIRKEAKKISGGFVIYSAIEVELKALISSWFMVHGE